MGLEKPPDPLSLYEFVRAVDDLRASSNNVYVHVGIGTRVSRITDVELDDDGDMIIHTENT